MNLIDYQYFIMEFSWDEKKKVYENLPPFVRNLIYANLLSLIREVLLPPGIM